MRPTLAVAALAQLLAAVACSDFAPAVGPEEAPLCGAWDGGADAAGAWHDAGAKCRTEAGAGGTVTPGPYGYASP